MCTKSESSDSLLLKFGGSGDYQIKTVDVFLYIKSKRSMLGYLKCPGKKMFFMAKCLSQF